MQPGPDADEDREDGPRLKFGSAVDQYQLSVAPDKSAFHVLELPPTVVDEIRAEHLAKRRGEVAEAKALDSHAMLARLKVAVGLMWLNGRTDKVSEEDWDLAGIVLAVSNAARSSVLAAMKSNTTKAARARGRQDAEREAVKVDVLRDRTIARLIIGVRDKLRTENHQKLNALKKRFSGHDREYVDEALERLVGVGDVELEEIDYNGNPGHVVHLKAGR
jgi:hypothetical protein